MSQYYQVAHNDEVFNIKQWLDTAHSAKCPFTYRDKKYIEFRPSHITACPLAQILHAIGYVPRDNQDLVYAALVGKAIHAHMLNDILSLQSLDLLPENVDNIEIEKKVFSRYLPLSGSVDLLVTAGENKYLGELKTYGGRIYREVKRTWFFQTQAYLMMSGAKYAFIWQASRSFGNISATYFRIEPSPQAFDWIANRIEILVDLIESGDAFTRDTSELSEGNDCEQCQYCLICQDKQAMSQAKSRAADMPLRVHSEESFSQ